MPKINLNRFNSKLIQERFDFCIPACIQGMMQFQDPACNISQQEILRKITINEEDGQPSFRSVKESAEVEFPEYKIEQLNASNYNDWLGYIKNEIDDGFPIAISTRSSPTTAHITLVVGYDDQNKILLVYNTGTTEFIQQGENVIYKITAGIEHLSFEDAEKRFNAPNPCTDLLTIRKNNL